MAIASPVSNQSTPTPPVIDQVETLAKELHERGAKDGARRLKILSRQYQRFTVDSASQFIRKDEIIDELESQSTWGLRFLHVARNFFSIAPIVITWFILGLAALAYQSDLSDPRYRDQDRYQSFLYLWQNGFHGNHGWVIPFSDAAFTDFVVLAILVSLIIILPRLERRYREKLHASLKGSDAVIDDLLILIAQDGANAHLAQSDVDKISDAVSQALKEQLDRVMLNYDRVTIEIGDMVKDTHEKTTDILAYTHEKTKEVFDDFKKDLAVYNSDIKLLNNSLMKMDTNLGSYGQKLGELTDASNKLAGSSNDLALNAKSMAESATLSSQASQGISTQLGALNLTQQEIVKTQKDVVQELATTQHQVVLEVTNSQQTVVQKITDSQKVVVDQFNGAADKVAISGRDTRDAAKAMESAASNLDQLAHTGFQSMTDGITQANQVLDADVRKTANEVQQVVSSLNGVNAQLAQSSQELQTTMRAFTQAMNDAAQKLSTSIQALPGAQQKKPGFWPWQR